jgi:hypothetical protein
MPSTDYPYTNAPILACELEDLEDFKSFAHWLNRQSHGPTKRIMSALYEYDEASDIFRAEFQIVGEKPTKHLFITNKRYIASTGSLDDYIMESIGRNPDTPFDQRILEPPASGTWNMNFASICEDASSKKLIETIKDKKPYLKEHTSIDVGYVGQDEAYYATVKINIPIDESSVLSSVLQDATETVEKLGEKSSEIFYKKLDKEINRVGRSADRGQTQ